MESTTPHEALRVLVIGGGTLQCRNSGETCTRTLLTVGHDKRFGWILDGPGIQQGKRSILS
jgi:hypothetical protein